MSPETDLAKIFSPTADRRSFLKTAAAASTALACGVFTRSVVAEDAPKPKKPLLRVEGDVKITRVVGFELPLKRAKIAGRNAYKDVHGDTSSDLMLRVHTSAGVDGVGACAADQKTASELLGKSVASLFDGESGRFSGSLGAGTMPLWDVLGKLSKSPVYDLLGGVGLALADGSIAATKRKTVPVYDGSIYFADLLPQYADKWQDRFREEIDQGMQRGHTAFKIKIGRGKKWMKRDEGDRRDIEVVQLIHKHAPQALHFVDANNGYDLAGAKRFIDATADCNLGFVEEMFEEAVEPCLELKKHMAGKGLKTLLADGETQAKLDPFKPLVAAGAIDILQGDMKHYGFEGIFEEAAIAATGPKSVQIAPHNWGSLMGYYMQLHVGRALRSFYRAEHDPLSTDLIKAEGYSIKGGEATVSEAPGFGFVIDEKKFANAKIRFDVKA